MKTLLCIGSLDEPSLLAEEAMEEVLSQAESENNINTSYFKNRKLTYIHTYIIITQKANRNKSHRES